MAGATYVRVVIGVLAGAVALSAQQAPAAGGVAGARIVGKAVSMDDFARELATQFRQILTNRTGLHGRFELDLQYTPDSSTAAAPEFPSIVTAVQEQLGLKLEAERAPVQVLVIDSVQRPTPD